MAENKTVRGINRACALTTDPSCLHRWLTEVEWDVTALPDHRLAWLQQAPPTRYSARGVMAIDHTLVDHTGKRIEEGGWFWDHADPRHVLAHDALLSHYVCPSKAPSPLEWRRLKQRDAWAAQAGKDQTAWGIELTDDVLKREMPGDFTCESSCTSAKVLNHIQSTQRGSVGELKRNRKGVYEGREPTRPAVARPMPWAAQKPVRVGSRR